MPGAFVLLFYLLQLRTSKAEWNDSNRSGSAEPHNSAPFISSASLPTPRTRWAPACQQHSPLSTAEGSGALIAVHTQASLEGWDGSSWVCAQGSSSGGRAWLSSPRISPADLPSSPIPVIPRPWPKHTHTHTQRHRDRRAYTYIHTRTHTQRGFPKLIPTNYCSLNHLTYILNQKT